MKISFWSIVNLLITSMIFIKRSKCIAPIKIQPNRVVLIGEDCFRSATLFDEQETVLLTSVNIEDIRQLSSNKLSLIVTRSTLTVLPNQTFDKLFHLMSLNLRNNSIKRIEEDVFWNLTSLRILDLGENNLNQISDQLFNGLKRLETLYLDGNQFRYFQETTIAVSFLTSLRRLVLNDNKFKDDQLTENHFLILKRLKSLSVLELNSCNISKVSANVLNGFVNLNCLFVEDNSLTSFNLNNLLIGLRGSINLIRLSIGNSRRLTDGNRYPRLDAQVFPHFPNLSRLDSTNCDVSQLDSSLFESLPNLKWLNLRSNQLGGFPKSLQKTNLIHLDIADNSNYFTDFILGDSREHDMPRLQSLDLSGNKVGELKANSFGSFPSLLTLNMTGDQLTIIEPFAFSSLVNLETLELSYNTMEEIYNDTFAGLIALKTLIIDHNNLKIYPRNHFFRNLFNLTYLSFRYNSLCDMWPWLLVDQINLITMDFSNNKILSWNEKAFINNHRLKRVYFQKNVFTQITQTMIDDLKGLEYADLSDNPYNCSNCEIVLSQKWIRNNSYDSRRANVRLPENDSRHANDRLLENNNRHANDRLHEYNSRYDKDRRHDYLCQEISGPLDGLPVLNVAEPPNCHKTEDNSAIYLVAGIASACFLLVTVVAGLVLYRLRYYAKYYWHLWCICHSKGKRFGDNCGFKYDIYISYSEKDRNWLENYLLPNLESLGNNAARCFVRDRDCELGRHIIDNILDGMDESRLFLAITSEHYMQSSWRMWELKLAMCRAIRNCFSNVIVLNIDGSTESNLTTRSIRTAINTQVYLKWTTDSFKQKAVFEKIFEKLSQRSV